MAQSVRASSPDMCRAELHLLEHRPQLDTYYLYRLSCTVSVFSIILSISPPLSPLEDGDVQNKEKASHTKNWASMQIIVLKRPYNFYLLSNICPSFENFLI